MSFFHFFYKLILLLVDYHVYNSSWFNWICLVMGFKDSAKKKIKKINLLIQFIFHLMMWLGSPSWVFLPLNSWKDCTFALSLEAIKQIWDFLCAWSCLSKEYVYKYNNNMSSVISQMGFQSVECTQTLPLPHRFSI